MQGKRKTDDLLLVASMARWPLMDYSSNKLHVKTIRLTLPQQIHL